MGFGEMRQHKYVVVLAAIAILIIAPGAIARICGASFGLLAGFAVFQMFAVVLFFLTMPATLILCIVALVRKEWKRAGILFAGIFIPILAYIAFIFSNYPGFMAIMGI